MKRMVRIVLIAVAAVILLVAGLIAVLLATMSDDGYRRLAAYLVERATGRTMIVDGRFAIHPSLQPSLVMSNVRILNPPWASGADLARIGHIEVQVPLRPLLSGTLVIERLILNDATFALERRADGEANWAARPSDGDLGLVPVFGTVRLRNVDWSYRDDASGHRTATQLAHLTLEDAGGTGRLDAQGVWDGQAIAATGTLGTLAEALHPTSPFPLDLAISLPGLDLGVRGTIAEPADGRGLDLHLVGKSDDIGPLLERLDSAAPLVGPLEGEVTLRGDFGAVQVPDLRLSAGNPPALEAKGAIAAVRPGDAPLLHGIALEIECSTTTAALATWLERPLPDLGPVAGQLMLSGNSETLKVSDIKLQAGAKDGPTLAASGSIGQIELDPALLVHGVDLQLEAEAPDLAALGTPMDVSLPHGLFSYTGRLSGDPDRWALSGELRLGDTAVTQTFTGSIAGAPPRLSGELSVALAGLEVTARGSVADPADGQGLDLHLVGHADDVARFASLLGHKVPFGGRLTGEATIGGDLAALRFGDLHLSLDDGASQKGQPALEARGQIASVTPSGATLLDGIALQVRSTTSTTVLASWLGRPLPDLGPVQGQFLLSGTSQVMKVTELNLRAGTADRLSITATGGVGRIRLGLDPTVERADLRLDAKAPDGAIVGALLKADIPRLGALSYSGRLSGDAANWALAGKLQIGQTAIDEDLTGSYAGARPRISGKLSIPTLHLADFGVALGRAPRSKDGPPSTSGGAWPSAVPSALKAVDLDLRLDVGEVEGTRLAIGRGEVDLTLKSGVLRLDPARFDFVAGTTLIHATADARAQPPQLDLSLHADDVQLGEFLTAMGRTAPITGELALILKLQSRGDSPEQLTSSLGGEADIAIQRGDVDLKRVNLATANLMTWLLAGADRGTGLLGGAMPGGRTKLECFAGRFAIKNGIATVQSLLMKTPLTLSTASGALDLVDRTVDLHVRLKPVKAVLSPETTYRVQGPMDDPSVDYSKAGFVAHALEGLVLTPLDALGSLLLPLVSDHGADPSNPCLS
jgi:hypothetical protein